MSGAARLFVGAAIGKLIAGRSDADFLELHVAIFRPSPMKCIGWNDEQTSGR